jgi:hypothetical protein
MAVYAIGLRNIGTCVGEVEKNFERKLAGNCPKFIKVRNYLWGSGPLSTNGTLTSDYVDVKKGKKTFLDLTKGPLLINTSDIYAVLNLDKEIASYDRLE